jgi:hypothetical protein
MYDPVFQNLPPDRVPRALATPFGVRAIHAGSARWHRLPGLPVARWFGG